MAQESDPRVHDQVTNTSWIPPPFGMVKCNVDTGFNNIRRTSNRGWCVRNNMGSFVIAGAAWDVGISPVLDMEALALKEAMLNAIDLGLDHVIFESDSQNVTNAIRSNHNGISEFSF